jgi:hypothetical protein
MDGHVNPDDEEHHENSDNHEDDVEDSDYSIYNSHQKSNDFISDRNPYHYDEPLLSALTTNNPSRAAIAATFRGYCCELFVFGKCSQSKNCPNDHSSAAQERCLQSFNLLSKRELAAHGLLPAWSQNSNTQPRSDYRKGFTTQHGTGRFDSPPGKNPYVPTKSN